MTVHVVSMETDLSTPEAAELERIARILSVIPGADGRGIGAPDRAAIFAFLVDPTWERWRAIVNVTVTRRHKLRLAVMRHCTIGMYTLPTAEQVLDACDAASAGQIAP